MGSGKHEVQFVHELTPFTLIDRNKRSVFVSNSQLKRDLHERHCDQIELIRNGARMNSALWNATLYDIDTAMKELEQCRDMRKCRTIKHRIDALDDVLMMHERNGDTVEIALECAIDNAYLQLIGRQSLTESIIPQWYWTI